MARPSIMAANLCLDVGAVPEQQVAPNGARQHLTDQQQVTLSAFVDLVER